MNLNWDAIVGKFKNLIGRNFKKKSENVRKVTLGIRSRVIIGFSLIFLLVLFVLMVFTYFAQMNIVLTEKFHKASSVSGIIGNVSEFLLEKSLVESQLERESQKNFIISALEDFLRLNSEVVEVVILNGSGKMVLSFGSDVLSLKKIKSEVKGSVKKQFYFDLKVKGKEKDNKDYKVIVQPIVQSSGLLISVNNDFDDLVKKLHEKGLSSKDQEYYYSKLIKKYEKFLPKEFLSKDSKFYGDLHFLFLSLYKEAFNKRGVNLGKDSYLLSDSWLQNAKRDINRYLGEGNLTKVKNTYDKIYENLCRIREYGEEFRYLGASLVVFDVTKMLLEINKNLKLLFFIFVGVYILSVLAIYWLSGFYVKNIKELEKWAIQVSNGDLGVRCNIKSRDEVGRLSDVFNYMLDEVVSRYHLEKFVSKETVGLVKSKKTKDILLGGHKRKNYAFLFSDVRGFTAFSEKNDPDLVIQVLNEYFEMQAGIISKYKGDIDDYVGDQIMAHFSSNNRCDNAIYAALEIVKAVKKFNEDRKSKGMASFEVGIGLHAGDVIVGSVGAGFRMDYACVGDVVNTASRLCSSAKPMEILASKEIVESSKKDFKYEEIEPLILKGKEKPFEVYRIIP